MVNNQVLKEMSNRPHNKWLSIILSFIFKKGFKSYIDFMENMGSICLNMDTSHICVVAWYVKLYAGLESILIN